MSKLNRSSKITIFMLIVASLTILLSSCGIYTLVPFSVNPTVDVSIPDYMLENQTPTFQVDGHNFWEPFLDHVSRMELHDGFLRFVGVRYMQDGSILPGSIDLYFYAVQDHLAGRIIAMDVPGFTLEDPLVVKTNADLSVEYTWLLRSHGGNVLFKEVDVTEDALHMKIVVQAGY